MAWRVGAILGVAIAALSGGLGCAAGLAETAPARSEADLLRQMREASQMRASSSLAQAGGSVFSVSGIEPPRGHVVLRQSFEPLAEAAAFQHGIGTAFFKRLIRQESGYNPAAVSRAGAQGIAQFMPGTAAMMGLDDPFDPVKALPKSAEHLADLQRRLGNEGLAAAAYNAGEGRVRAWLAGRSGLPLETQNYVLSITGRHAHEWAPAGVAPVLAAAYASMQATRALAGPTFTRPQSAEWQVGIKLMPEKSRVTVLLSEPPRAAAPRTAGASASRGTKSASALTGEKALCASMGGCIVAAVY